MIRARDKKDREKAEKLSGCVGLSSIKVCARARVYELACCPPMIHRSRCTIVDLWTSNLESQVSPRGCVKGHEEALYARNHSGTRHLGRYALSNGRALSNTGYRLHRAMMQVNISDKDTLTLTCSAQLTSARSQGVGMLAFQHRFSPALVGHATV